MNQKQASIMSIGIIIALSIIPMAFAEGNVEITTHSVEHTAGTYLCNLLDHGNNTSFFHKPLNCNVER